MKQDYLREKAQKLKKEFSIPFCFIATKLNMNRQSFYNFMGKQKNLSSKREKKALEIIERLESNEL